MIQNQTAPEGLETLAGAIERVTFHNAENGFAVLRVKARGQPKLVTVIGHTAAVAAGEFLTASGRWVNDRQHGLQFRADIMRTGLPEGVKGIKTYMASGMMRGIGPAMAERIVEAFGKATFDVIDRQPERLTEVSGIGPQRAQQIIAGWNEQRAVREIMIFLHQYGVGTARAVRIYRTYGQDAIRIMSDDPYRLARDVRGIGFRSADAIAEKLGLEKTSPKRLRAGILFTLEEAMGEGHCALSDAGVLAQAQTLLEVDAALIGSAIAAAVAQGEIIADTIGCEPHLFLEGLYVAERDIAKRLSALARGRPLWGAINLSKAVPWVEKQLAMHLSQSQRDAVQLTLTSKLTIITGGPGVGKTTLLAAILKILLAKGVAILLAAPTGRAAKRMSEKSGVPAKTIHRLLEIDPVNGTFRRTEAHPLDCDLLVVDETSMVDVLLMHALLRALRPQSGLLLVGDVDQLPSVGPGKVLADMIASKVLPVARLVEVFRQAAQSEIIANAHRINHGEMPEKTHGSNPGEFFFVETDSPDVAVSKIVEIVSQRIPRRFGLDGLRDVQVLCPMNRGALGARNLNVELQKALNPNPAQKVERFGWLFATNDRLMQTENDYDREVFNGDLGEVKRIDEESETVIVAFDGREIAYSFGELDVLVPAYAMTIHKSQGSEYPAVVIPLVTQHYVMLARNLLYTGVTRAKRLVVLVGQRRALAMAVKTKQNRARHTKLREWLAGALRGMAKA
jgi:exodeoxyribonuclease V alpha subunit